MSRIFYEFLKFLAKIFAVFLVGFHLLWSQNVNHVICSFLSYFGALLEVPGNCYRFLKMKMPRREKILENFTIFREFCQKSRIVEDGKGYPWKLSEIVFYSPKKS